MVFPTSIRLFSALNIVANFFLFLLVCLINVLHFPHLSIKDLNFLTAVAVLSAKAADLTCSIHVSKNSTWKTTVACLHSWTCTSER